MKTSRHSPGGRIAAAPSGPSGSYLVEAPVDFQPVAVRVAEFDGDLGAGAAPALEQDLDAMGLQMGARLQHLVDGGDLERHVMHAGAPRSGIRPLAGADQGDAVMVRVAAHEDHAAVHHRVGIDVRDPEAEDAGVEIDRALQVGDVEHDMADLADVEGQRPVRRLRAQGLRLRARQRRIVDHAPGHRRLLVLCAVLRDGASRRLRGGSPSPPQDEAV